MYFCTRNRNPIQKYKKSLTQKKKNMTKYNFLIIVNGKAVAGRQTEKGARRCAAEYCKKFPATEGNVVWAANAETGEEL